ncbi:major centromere autoantigen B-like [Passer montanus]|uniref:major centromere autoantigen B-like n=1 Tax=Passer montanus TaxID=9160 RepID=UPI001960A2C9|nr:major centromere autoantigen B-like [Passer montanus]
MAVPRAPRPLHVAPALRAARARPPFYRLGRRLPPTSARGGERGGAPPGGVSTPRPCGRMSALERVRAGGRSLDRRLAAVSGRALLAALRRLRALAAAKGEWTCGVLLTALERLEGPPRPGPFDFYDPQRDAAPAHRSDCPCCRPQEEEEEPRAGEEGPEEEEEEPKFGDEGLEEEEEGEPKNEEENPEDDEGEPQNEDEGPEDDEGGEEGPEDDEEATFGDEGPEDDEGEPQNEDEGPEDDDGGDEGPEDDEGGGDEGPEDDDGGGGDED